MDYRLTLKYEYSNSDGEKSIARIPFTLLWRIKKRSQSAESLIDFPFRLLAKLLPYQQTGKNPGYDLNI